MRFGLNGNDKILRVLRTVGVVVELSNSMLIIIKYDENDRCKNMYVCISNS